MRAGKINDDGAVGGGGGVVEGALDDLKPVAQVGLLYIEEKK